VLGRTLDCYLQWYGTLLDGPSTGAKTPAQCDSANRFFLKCQVKAHFSLLSKDRIGAAGLASPPLAKAASVTEKRCSIPMLRTYLL